MSHKAFVGNDVSHVYRAFHAGIGFFAASLTLFRGPLTSLLLPRT